MDTSVFSEINWLAVLAGTGGYFFLGAIWYSFLFRKQWIAYHKIDMNNPDTKSGVGGVMLFSFILTFIISLTLAILIQKLALTQILSGVKLGLLTGIGFSMMALSITYLYLQRPLGLHFIDGLYHTVGQVISAVIICAIQ